MTPVTHCIHGHELTEENVYRHTSVDGYTRRNCRRCHNARVKEYQARKRAAARAADPSMRWRQNAKKGAK